MEDTTCAIRQDGTVACWGDNILAELAMPMDNGPHSLPADVPGIHAAVEIGGGSALTCVRLSGGTISCWGSAHLLGMGDTVGTQPNPTQIPGLTNVAQLSAGSDDACALEENGTVDCWGNNGAVATLGNGSTAAQLVPMPNPFLSGVAEIRLGFEEGCARKRDGTVWCWGDDRLGEVGNGTIQNAVLTPVQVQGITDATQVIVELGSACALLSDGTATCWGDNICGGLGRGVATMSEPLPGPVVNIAGIVKLAGGYGHTCALLTGGTVDCWGNNGAGQLGDGTMIDRYAPVPVPGLANVLDISAGGAQTCAVLMGGTVECWGENDRGQVGDGTTENRLSPTPVAL